LPKPGDQVIISGSVWNNEPQRYVYGTVYCPSKERPIAEDNGYHNGQPVWEIDFDDGRFDVAQCEVTYSELEADKVGDALDEWVSAGKPDKFRDVPSNIVRKRSMEDDELPPKSVEETSPKPPKRPKMPGVSRKRKRGISPPPKRQVKFKLKQKSNSRGEASSDSGEEDIDNESSNEVLPINISTVSLSPMPPTVPSSPHPQILRESDRSRSETVSEEEPPVPYTQDVLDSTETTSSIPRPADASDSSPEGIVEMSFSDFHVAAGHLSYTSLKHNANHLGVRLTGAPVSNCEDCARYKRQAKQVPQRAVNAHAKSPLDEVQIDFAKLMEAFDGSKYLMATVDIHTGKVWVDTLKRRKGGEMRKNIRRFVTKRTAEGKYKLQRVHSDNEKGMLSNKTQTYFNRNGITHVVDPPYTAEMRGIVERKIARLKTITSLLLHQARFRTNDLKRYWPFAAKCAARIINNSVPQRKGKTPNQMFGSKAEKLWKLPIFGSVAWVLKGDITKGEKTTFGERAIECVYLDFCDRGRGEDDRRVIHFLNPDTLEVGTSQSFKISNGEFYEWQYLPEQVDKDDLSVTSEDLDDASDSEGESVVDTSDSEGDSVCGSDDESVEGDFEDDASDDGIAARESSYFIRPSQEVIVERACVINVADPLQSCYNVYGAKGKIDTKSLSNHMCPHLSINIVTGPNQPSVSGSTYKPTARVDAGVSKPQSPLLPSSLPGGHCLNITMRDGLPTGRVHNDQSTGPYQSSVSESSYKPPARVDNSGVSTEVGGSSPPPVEVGVGDRRIRYPRVAVPGAGPSQSGVVKTPRVVGHHTSSRVADNPSDGTGPSVVSPRVESYHASSSRSDSPDSGTGPHGRDGTGLSETGLSSPRLSSRSDPTGPSVDPKLGSLNDVKHCTTSEGDRVLPDVQDLFKGLDLSGKVWIRLEDRQTHKVYNVHHDFRNAICYTIRPDHKMPTTLGEINGHPDSELIWESIQKELKSLIDNETWELVPRPKGRKVVKSKWVLTVKLTVNGDIERYKARFVAKGFSQVLGLDFHETYAPVVSTVTLRIVLAMMAAKGWSMTQLDVETAFLNSDIDEEIYVEQPEGCDDPDHPRKDFVLKMLKALYGLRQSPYLWNKLITEVLISKPLSLKQNTSIDECLFVARGEDGRVAIICLYVDDLVITGDWTEKIDQIKSTLYNKFKMRDVSDKGMLLGMAYEYNREKRTIKVHQAPFVKKVVERFQDVFPGGLKPSDTPASTNTYQEVFKAMESGKDPKLNFPYREVIGSLLYLVVMTRPDLANIVRFLSRFVTCYTEIHVKCLARVVGYVMHNPMIGLKYSSLAPNTGKLHAYSDASFNDDPGTARSTNATVVMLNGSAVAWKSTMMNFVVMSSTHSEYGAMSEAVFSALHCRDVLNFAMGQKETGTVEVRSKQENAVTSIKDACVDERGVRLNVDNMAAIHIATHELHSKRSKHINLRFMNVRDAVLRNDIDVKWVSTTNQLADLLTKCLAVDQFRVLRNSIMSSCE